MTPDEVWPAAVTILGGAFAGGITNAIAIWMLFRPHEPAGIGPFRLQGAIPKNKARLARSIAKTVGEKLLTSADLAERLAAPPVRRAFDEAVGTGIRGLLEREHGSLRTELPAPAVGAIESGVAELAGRLASRLADWVAAPEFDRVMAGWLSRLEIELAGRPVGELLTPARREAVVDAVDQWVEQVTESRGLERTLRHWVTDRVRALEADPRPLAERLPAAVLDPIEQAITDALPGALDRLGDLLSHPEAKDAVRRALREALDTAGRELLFHERILAKLVVNDKTLARWVDGFEGEGFDRLAAAVTAPEMRARVALAVQSGLATLLREPLGARLARLDPERRAGLESTIGDWLLAAARSPGTRASLREAIVGALDRAGDLTWDQVIARLPAPRVAEFFRSVVTGEGGRVWLGGAIERTALRLLDHPVGRPADWLGPDTTGRVTDAITRQSWTWIESQVPMIAARLDLPEMVEQKINSFPTPVMEDIIKRVIDRELKLIVQLGWLLGAVVGTMAWGFNRLL